MSYEWSGLSMKIKFEDKLSIYEQKYFTYDKPVPFKADLYIYPAKVKDYYNFYNLISCFTMDKNDDPSGEGLSMTDLQYVFHLMKQDNSFVFKDQFVGLLELVFQIENGLFCDNPKCEHKGDIISYQEIRPKVEQINVELIHKYQGIENGEELFKQEKQKRVYELQLCPHCQQMMRDVFEFEEKEGKPILTIHGIPIKNKEFKELKRTYCYQNLSDFDDTYIDPELKAALEETNRLKSGKTEQPTLERQMSCIAISSGYSYEQIENLTLRKFTQLLRVADAKLSYLASKIGEMSGLVTFKSPIPHWIYTKENARKSMFDNIMTVDQIQKKIGNSGVME